jgi:uncharacterized protein YndB with AHSA1/START domain
MSAPTQVSDFVISRTFDAPRALVWKAFTEVERMKQWWGPKGFTVIAATMDLRPGGTFHYALRAPDGQTMWGRFVYREIVPPERIVLVSSFSDEAGGITRHPLAPTWPREMLSTFTFVEEGGKTTMTVRWSPLDASAEELEAFERGRDGMRAGWGGTLDQFGAYLANAKV